MTLHDDEVRGAAELLADHRQSGETLRELPERLRPVTLTDAYAVQDRLTELLVARHGGRTIGYKVACTNLVAQQALHIDSPLFGRLLEHSTSPAPAKLDPTAFTTGVIECEFGLRMAADVPTSGTPYDAESIAAYVGDVLPAIEVVDHRFLDWSLGACSIAADNAIHGHWVRGAPFDGDWRTLDLASHAVHATIDGTAVGHGTGAAVLGHPLNVAAWLANELPHYGHRLAAGDYITTGVCTEVFSAEPGQHVRADFGSLGVVEVTWGS